MFFEGELLINHLQMIPFLGSDTPGAGATPVHMGPFREIRMKKTAPRGFKDESDTRHADLRIKVTRASWKLRIEKDRASWSDTGPYGSF